jgi:hypothetical protein
MCEVRTMIGHLVRANVLECVSKRSESTKHNLSVLPLNLKRARFEKTVHLAL